MRSIRRTLTERARWQVFLLCVFAVPALFPSGWVGLHRWCLDCPRSLVDQFSEARDVTEPAKPILQVVPEVHSELPARLLQAGERIPTPPTGRAPCAAADLAFLHIFPDVRLTGIVVQRHLRPLQHPHQVRLLVPPLFHYP